VSFSRCPGLFGPSRGDDLSGDETLWSERGLVIEENARRRMHHRLLDSGDHQ